MHRKKAQEVQRSHVRDVRAAMAAAAVFQEPVAPSAQQLRHQLHGFVICQRGRDLPRARSRVEGRQRDARHRGGNSSAGMQPGAGTIPAQYACPSVIRVPFYAWPRACRWCRHVKPSRTTSTRCANGRSNSSPRAAKHERPFAASFAARRRWRARWHLGVQPQQGRGGDLSLLRTTLEASVQRTGGVSSVSVIKMRFNHTSKLDLYMFRLASQTTPSPQSTHIINHLLYTGSNTSNRRQCYCLLHHAPCTISLTSPGIERVSHRARYSDLSVLLEVELLLVPSNDFVLAVGLVAASAGKWSCVRAFVHGRVRDVLRPAALDA